MGNSSYGIKGLYGGYDKNNKEREALDYYATPPAEVRNILDTLKINFTNQTILEPCIGGGHMGLAIESYINDNNQKNVELIGTDIQDRGFKNDRWELRYNLDFFADDYPIYNADWVIMNPPYSVIEPFTIRALEIAKKGVVSLARLQFIEGESRYNKIWIPTPPTSIYAYVDRINCWKNGEAPETTGQQAYCWVVWEKDKMGQGTFLHQIRRADKH